MPSDYSPEAWHSKRSEVDEAPVHIFVMGVDRWRDEQEWPLARTRYTPLYLASKGYANALTGDGKLEWKLPKKNTADHFRYDPRNPVPTRGGAVCCDPKVFPWGPMDQRGVENRGRCAGVYQRSVERGSGSDRADSRGAVRVHLGPRHRLHGQAGGRVSEWRSAQLDGRHPAHALSRRAGKGRAGAARARFIRWRSTRA